MASPLLTKLAEKVRLATLEIHNLRKERERLLAEVALMDEESRRARRLIREHGELVAERSKTRERLEKILAKLDQLKVV
jgi:FtsZ-binding cell division protein ZapB